MDDPMTPTVPDAPLTPAVFHILAALEAGPLHGYAIMKRVEQDSGIEMGPGTIYGSIQRMEEAGLVTEDDRPLSGRRRNYRITPAGLDALRREAIRITQLASNPVVRRMASGGEAG